MASHIIQGFLHDAVQMDGNVVIEFAAALRLLVADLDSGAAVRTQEGKCRPRLRSLFRPAPPDAGHGRGSGPSRASTVRSPEPRGDLAASGSDAWRSVRCSMAPMAVRIWPNSSCSSREIERKVFSCMEMSCCARSLRLWASAASSQTAAGCTARCRARSAGSAPASRPGKGRRSG